MAVVQDAGTWDVLETEAVGFTTDLHPSKRRVRIVYRRVGEQWIP